MNKQDIESVLENYFISKVFNNQAEGFVFGYEKGDADITVDGEIDINEMALFLKAALSQPQEAVAWTCNDINFDNIDKSFEQFCKDNLILSPMFAYMLKNLAPPNYEALLKDNERLREVLERLARLGNGEHYGNSDGNCIAIEALKKGE